MAIKTITHENVNGIRLLFGYLYDGASYLYIRRKYEKFLEIMARYDNKLVGGA